MAADVVLFDPATIGDHATFEKPMQFATGVRDVFVNGAQVLKDGQPTGAKPGRFVKGRAGRVGPVAEPAATGAHLLDKLRGWVR